MSRDFRDVLSGAITNTNVSRRRKSQWGTLGPAENAAGVIYMEINFDQPPDCKLVSATVQLTLDEDDPGLKEYHVDSLPYSECPVLITDYYGPGQIVGTSKRMSVKKGWNLEPSVNVAGNGGSLGGKTYEKQFEHESRWTFRSHKVPGERNSRNNWGHRILRWEMTENDIEKYPTHANKVFTAFAYEHSGQPFLMKVEIFGRLEKLSGRLKAKAKKFGPRSRKQEDVSTTLVGAYLGRRRPLDELAGGLANAMELENHMAVPLELPNTQTASFQQVAYDSRPSTINAVGDANAAAQVSIEGRPAQPELRLEGQTLELLEERRVPAFEDRTQPTLENLARIGEYYSTPVRREVVREDIREDISEASEHSSATTLVANQNEQVVEPPPRDKIVTVPRSKRVDDDAMARLMEVAVLRMLLQFILSVMDLLGPREAQTREEVMKKEGEINPSRRKAMRRRRSHDEG